MLLNSIIHGHYVNKIHIIFFYVGSLKCDTKPMAFTNATVEDLVAKGILDNHSDSTRAVASSIFTSGESVIMLLKYEESMC